MKMMQKMRLIISPVGGAEVTSLNPVLDWPDVNDVDPLDVLNYTLYLDIPDPGITTIEVGKLVPMK